MRLRLTTLVCVLTLCLVGCGGGGGGGGSNAVVPAAPNVLRITVDPGPPGTGNVNIPYASVTVCLPGNTTTCQTIDHVAVDTGSTGLRILASALDPSLALPQQSDGSGHSVAECAAFADSFAWGAVRLADVKLAAATASSIPIQVIGDPAFPAVPASCSSQGPRAENSVQELGANGILGVGVFVEDCGPSCANSAVPGTYYICPPAGCQSIAAPLASQVQNPVARLPADNNGVVISLPAVPASGAPTVSGSLILGVGTQSNNGLGRAVVFDLDASGTLTTLFNNQTLVAFVDSGSNGFFFPDAGIPVCPPSSIAPGFYCPATSQRLTATIQAAGNGMNGTVNFNVANAETLLSNSPNFAAFNNLGGPFVFGTIFDWGLPFFYGRTVFTAIEQRSTPAGPGPYIAY